VTDLTTTAPNAIAAFLTSVGAAMTGPNADVRVYEAWPGPDGQAEMVVLGETTWANYEIATIKAGRQARTEEYTLGFEVFVVGAEGTSPSLPEPARARAYEILAVIEDVLADEPQPPSGPTVAWTQIRPENAGPRVFEKGWAYRIAGTIPVTARLN
jgi:hypothetical protein